MRALRLALSAFLAFSGAACGRPAAPAPGEAPGRPSKYGLLTSSRWAYGAAFRREDLKPVARAASGGCHFR